MYIKTITFVFIIFQFSSNVFASTLGEQKVRELLNTYFAAWETRNIEEIGVLYDENISVYDLPADTSMNGKNKVLNYEQAAWLKNAPDMVWVKTGPAYIAGNTAAYEWVYAGTFNGEWRGNTIAHKTFSIKGISTTAFNDEGKIIFQKDFYDIKSFEAQLGVK